MNDGYQIDGSAVLIALNNENGDAVWIAATTKGTAWRSG
jgi:hypothetical protein